MTTKYMLIQPFIQQSSGDISNWKLRITPDGDYLHFQLFWGDKELPTHQATQPREIFENFILSGKVT